MKYILHVAICTSMQWLFTYFVNIKYQLTHKNLWVVSVELKVDLLDNHGTLSFSNIGITLLLFVEKQNIKASQFSTRASKVSFDWQRQLHCSSK